MKDLEYLAKQADYALIVPSPKQAISAKPETILAIAEAFRELEQEVQKNLDGALAWQQRAETTEAKLAELQKQEPATFTSEHYWSELNTFGAVKSVLLKNGNDPDFQVELFTRAAPAADLAELVPGNDLLRVLDFAKFVIKCVRKNGEYAPLSSQEPNEIDAILRNIEEANK